MNHIINITIKKMFLFLFITYFICNTYSESQILISFRMDDPSSTSDWLLDNEIISTFINNDTPLTVGVVPFSQSIPLSGEILEILRESEATGLVEIALHGYSHEDRQKNNIPSEFCNVSLAEQQAQIIAGKNFLDSLFSNEITTFVPPFNTYDSNTIQILEDQRFKLISAAMFGPIIEESSIKYLPYTTTLTNLRDTIEVAERMTEVEYPIIIIALFHNYDFLTADYSIDDLSSLLDWLDKKKNLEAITLKNMSSRVNYSNSDYQHRLLVEYNEYRTKTDALFLFRNRVDPFFYKNEFEPDPLGMTNSIPFKYDETILSSYVLLALRILSKSYIMYFLVSLLLMLVVNCIIKLSTKWKGLATIKLIISCCISSTATFIFWYFTTFGYKWLFIANTIFVFFVIFLNYLFRRMNICKTK